ncbi:IS30 family transposase [Bifidobacterium breve]|uniref:IS30 family transposase n=1 Tax=Bifidobacterium breve TaxID=1685 RepID=UPI00202EE935|nr:IS30 family transposase [Bifidobacterium breve]MCM0691624.1 IS30 family transposase [Bifidobacterium sp. M3-N-101]
MRAPRHGASRWPRDALPRGRRRRRKAGGGRAGRGRVPLRTSICERPCGQDDRSRFGEWEADGVIGAGCSLHTEVGRRTRFPMAAIVPDKTAAASVVAQEAMFSRLPAAARTGVTHDDGTEFARYAGLRDEPGMATYFADPYSSWRRGGNENRNGMIRRYPPKRTPIAPSMARELLESAENKDVALTNR